MSFTLKSLVQHWFFLICWPRHSGTVTNSKAPLFLCQLISHAIMHYAEMSLGPTDYRALGSSARGSTKHDITLHQCNERTKTPLCRWLVRCEYSKFLQHNQFDWNHQPDTELILLIQIYFQVLCENVVWGLVYTEVAVWSTIRSL